MLHRMLLRLFAISVMQHSFSMLFGRVRAARLEYSALQIPAQPCLMNRVSLTAGWSVRAVDQLPGVSDAQGWQGICAVREVAQQDLRER